MCYSDGSETLRLDSWLVPLSVSAPELVRGISSDVPIFTFFSKPVNTLDFELFRR